jgi:hypothetical protein
LGAETEAAAPPLLDFVSRSCAYSANCTNAARISSSPLGTSKFSRSANTRRIKVIIAEVWDVGVDVDVDVFSRADDVLARLEVEATGRMSSA